MAAATTTTTQPNGFTIPPPTEVVLTPSTAGIFHIPQITPESARTASTLLQENHVKNHIFFNQSGFHNHIAHHLLTLFSLGATPSQLQAGFAFNQSYQRPRFGVKADVLERMRKERKEVGELFGKEKYFRDFEEFFAGEIQKVGLKGVLGTWLFKGDGVAEGLLTRMFAGFFHPIIHFGFGLEFHQPAIIVEALAQAAVHDNWVAPYLLGCEKAASARKSQSKKSLIDILHEARANEKIRNSPHQDDGNKMRDGVIGRAADEMISVASQWTVSPTLEGLKFKTAEMTQTAVYFTAGAQNPKKIPKFDFFYMHSANASVFYRSFIEDEKNLDVFGEGEAKYKNLARMLEMKARADLAIYVSRNCPELDVQRIKDYEPKKPSQKWDQIFARACAYDDDGHTSKLVRAIANAENVCKPYEEKENWPVQGGMWLKLGNMVMDSVEADGPRWVRGAGWEDEWKEVPDRKDAKL